MRTNQSHQNRLVLSFLLLLLIKCFVGRRGVTGGHSYSQPSVWGSRTSDFTQAIVNAAAELLSVSLFHLKNYPALFYEGKGSFNYSAGCSFNMGYWRSRFPFVQRQRVSASPFWELEQRGEWEGFQMHLWSEHLQNTRELNTWKEEVNNAGL